MLFIGATSSSVENTFRIGCAAADDVVEAEAVVQLRAQLGVLLPQPPLLERRAQHPRQLRELKRLDQEIDGAALDRRDRVVDAAEAGDHDGADRRVQRERFVEHVHAVGVGQPQVDDQRVVGEAMQPFDGVGAVQRLGDGEAVGLEAVDDHLAKAGFIFDNEHGRTRTIDNTVSHGTSGAKGLWRCDTSQ